MAAHLDHEDRQGQHGRQYERPAQLANFAIGLIIGTVAGFQPGGVIANAFHRRDQRGGVLVEGGDRGHAIGQVDRDRGDTGHLRQGIFHPGDARGAGHALDPQAQPVRHGRIASGPERPVDRFADPTGIGPVQRHAGGTGGKVDLGTGNTGNGGNGPFGPAHAAGAAEPVNFEIEALDGHFCPLSMGDIRVPVMGRSRPSAPVRSKIRCQPAGASGKNLAIRISAVRAWPSIPSRREMRAVASASGRIPSRVARCQVTVFMNLATDSPPV